jgi:hypothetical protein
MKLGIEEMHFNIIQDIYDKPIVNFILNEEKKKLFPIKSGMRQECPLSPILFNIVLEFLPRAIRKEEEITGIEIGEEEVKLPFFSDEMILYLKDMKNSTKNS